MKQTTSDYPISLPFLCYVITERQRLNKLRLSSCQKTNNISHPGYHDKVFGHKDNKKAQILFSAEFSRLYEELKTECKKFSKIITEVRKGLDAKIEWGTTANVISVDMPDGTTVLAKEMSALVQGYKMDEMLFPELKVELPTDIEALENRYKSVNYALKEFKKQNKRG
jgi:hypothetical protein